WAWPAHTRSPGPWTRAGASPGCCGTWTSSWRVRGRAPRRGLARSGRSPSGSRWTRKPPHRSRRGAEAGSGPARPGRDERAHTSRVGQELAAEGPREHPVLEVDPQERRGQHQDERDDAGREAPENEGRAERHAHEPRLRRVPHEPVDAARLQTVPGQRRDLVQESCAETADRAPAEEHPPAEDDEAERGLARGGAAAAERLLEDAGPADRELGLGGQHGGPDGAGCG